MADRLPGVFFTARYLGASLDYGRRLNLSGCSMGASKRRNATLRYKPRERRQGINPFILAMTFGKMQQNEHSVASIILGLGLTGGEMVPEPVVVVPEKVFEASLLEVALGLIKDSGCESLFVPKFGLDLAFFLQRNGRSYARFLEVKVYAAGRPGGVGFGTPKGEGPQVELLRGENGKADMLGTFVRWVVADATLPQGVSRYAIFDCRLARAAAMGDVRKGKQNNFRMSSLQSHFVTWPTLIENLKQFLLG